MDDPKNMESMNRAIEIAMFQHEEVLNKKESLAGRSNSLLGFTVALGIVYYQLFFEHVKDSSWLLYTTLFVFILEALIILLLLIASNFLLVRKVHSGPGADFISTTAPSMGMKDLSSNLLKAYTNAIRLNERTNLKVANILRYATISLIIGFTIGFLNFLIQVLPKLF